MNKFNVKTPDEWKENLFLNIEKPKKKINFKAVAAIAAVIAVVAASTTGFAYSQAPEYFGSMFFGNSQENLNSIYAPKNIVFKSDSEDFTLICEGIAGDRRSMIAVFELKSNGEFCFDPAETYFFGERRVETVPLPLNGYSISSSSTYIDEKNVLIDLHFNSESTNIIGDTVYLEFADIVYGFGVDEVTISCKFTGEIKVDYPNTVVRLSKTDEKALTEGISLTAKKAWISNLGFEFELKVTDGADKILSFQDHDLFLDKMTLAYADGTSEEFIMRMPMQSDRDIIVSSTFKDEKTIRIRGKFPNLVNSSKVVSVAFNDSVLFVV
ncbi:MAG: hypothetical protein IJE19_10480 [Clostridia bacterium]|nr:hypothetical protein [Clostridia bacterium]